MQIHVSRKGEKFGPYTLEVANQYLAEGSLKPDDLAWHEGAPEWVPLAQVPGITAAAPFAAAKSRVEGMAIGSLGVSLVALVLGGVTKWGGILLLIITGALGLAGLALGIIGIVRIKNGLGDLRGKWLAVSGAVISPLAIVLAVLMNTDGAQKKENNTDDNGKSASDNKPRTASKSDRVKCVYNVSQITKAMIAFSLDNNGRLPWHLTPRGMQYHFGEADAMNLGNIFASSALKADLQTSKILLSPCDPERKAANAKASEEWQGYSAREGRPVPLNAISYGLCVGADVQLPGTIMVITRNVSGEDLQGAKFLGDVMSLTANQGQFSRADGSAHQSNDDRLAETVMAHTNERGGLLPSPASTRLILPNN